MPNRAELPTLAALLSGDFSAVGIRHVVTGAIALGAHGFLRGTQDLDIVVFVPSIRLPEVFAVVRRHGFTGDDVELIRSLRDRKVAMLDGGKTSVEIIVPAIPWHHTILERAVVRRVDGRDVPFISPEDLIVQKLLWSRPKDLFDVRAFVGVVEAPLDEAYLQATLRSLLPANDPRLATLVELMQLHHSRP
ncbi:MAG: hypothetical protein HYR85_12005 [Planctomycetes bacterium]|nr:hypothetical protein [Planctomycetota bacterium]MBI3844411.1 hypothetical protein [Planctomycetota bacterium]